MAKQRIIKDNFWTDTYIEKLDPSEKLMYLYILTNPQNNISGAYEIQNRRIGFETGFDVEVVENILQRFETDEKITRFEDWIILNNFHKHQSFESPKMITGLNKILESYPKEIQELLKEIYPIHMVSKIALYSIELDKIELDKIELDKSQKKITSKSDIEITSVKFSEEIIERFNFSEKFDELWKLYNFKKAKGKAEAKFKSIINGVSENKRMKLFEEIIVGVKNYNNDFEEKVKLNIWTPQKQQLAPWLNGTRWEDEYTPNIAPKGTQAPKSSHLTSNKGKYD